MLWRPWERSWLAARRSRLGLRRAAGERSARDCCRLLSASRRSASTLALCCLSASLLNAQQEGSRMASAKHSSQCMADAPVCADGSEKTFGKDRNCLVAHCAVEPEIAV